MNAANQNYDQNNTRWIDANSIGQQPPEAQFMQIMHADQNFSRIQGQATQVAGGNFFLPDASARYNAGKQDLSNVKNAGERNKFLGFTKPDADGTTTMWLRGQDRSPEAELARTAQQKINGYIPENFGEQPFAFKGKLENGVFSMEGGNGKQIKIPEAQLRTATGKQLNKLIGKDVENGQLATAWRQERFPQSTATQPQTGVIAPVSGLSPVGKSGTEGGLNPQALLNQAPTVPMFMAPSMQPQMSTTQNADLPQFPQFAQKGKNDPYAAQDQKNMKENPMEAALLLLMKQQAAMQAQLQSYGKNKGGMYAPVDSF